MKNVAAFFLLAILFSLAALPSFSQNKKALDDKYGFKNAVLESDTTAFTDLVLVEELGHKKLYTRTTDELKIGETPLESISYVFYKGKLSTIVVTTDGITHSKAVLDALTTQYGVPYQANRFIKDYQWSGKRTFLTFTQNSATDKATIRFYSKPLMELETSESKQAAKQASSDL